MRYELRFFDFWHLGSGLSAGAKLDSTVVKDSDGVPYVPGKTIKGLLREAVEKIDETKAKEIFGDEETKIGKCYFSDALLSGGTREHIVKNGLVSELFEEITSTKIGENGIAEKGSLREIEVVVPLTLYGEIEGCEDKELMKKALMMIKRMGLNRNRGLGRCEFKVVEESR